MHSMTLYIELLTDDGVYVNIECKVLVHKNCISWEKYFEQETQIAQCCQTVDTIDVVTDSEVDIIPSLVNVAMTTDLIIDDSSSSVKVANITEVTKIHEMTPKVVVKKDSDIPFFGQNDELAKKTEDTKTTELKTDGEITAETDKARINDIKLAVMGVDAATVDANVINLMSAVVLQNDGSISANSIVRDSAIAVFMQDYQAIPTTIVDKYSVIAHLGQDDGEFTNSKDTNMIEISRNIEDTITTELNANSELTAKTDETSVSEINHAVIDVEAATLAVIEQDSAIANTDKDKECMSTEYTEEMKTPMHNEGAEAIESPKNVEAFEPSEVIEMHTDSEVSTAKIDVASINENGIAVINLEYITNEKYLESDFVLENHRAVSAVVVVNDSVNADFLQDDKTIPMAVIEKDSTSLKCNEPFTESNTSLGNTSNIITVTTPQYEAISSTEDNNGKIIPNVLSIISNRAQMNQEIYFSPTTPDVNTQLVELKEYDFEDLDRNPTDKEKITFIMNNLLAKNVQEKCDEINRILRQEHVQWFSGYLIEERVCYEFNRHELYSELLDRMGNEDLNALVLLKTADKIQILLNNDMRNSKAVLNNLGHWLGIITLAKNKPIPFHNSFLYSLLMRPYMKNDYQRLMFIIPFASKILLSCAKSQDFGLKSHWTINILKILAKLHQQPDLKLNLQFEIEVLYKSLNIELNDFYE